MLKNRKTLKSRHSKSYRVLKEFDNHEMVIGISDNHTKLKGYIAIHDTTFGPALGGTRLQYYRSEEDALRDVLNLSKAMSYKCAIAGLPWGGGKAVLFADYGADKDAMLASYARLVENLKGLFKTGTDLGILDEDVKKMSKHTRHMLGVSKADRGDLTTSKMAALGVYYCIKASLEHKYQNSSLKNKTVGIKGVGKLGGELARLVYEDGGHLVIADIDQEKIAKITNKYPESKVVSPTEIHSQKLDIYSPCAAGSDLTSKVAGELKAKIVAGGANNMLADDKIGDKLYEAGVLFAPDYVANAGGLIYVADELEKDGFHKDRVLKRVAGIQKTLAEIYTISNKQKIGTHRVANEVAVNRILAGKI